MRYIDEFRDIKLAKKLSAKIKAITPADGPINIMEVCGTHTQSFCRFGLSDLLPPNLNFISGPGCPVCVSSQGYIDQAIAYAKNKDTLILTFADMLRVPGSVSSLEKEKARGLAVGVTYSAWDSLKVARNNPDKKVVFLAVGFETTAPTIALTILEAKKQKLNNLFFFSSLKLIPAAMACLVQDKRLNLSGFLCPGHVSSIIGTRPYEFIAKRHKISCCVAGFEPLDILEGVYLILRQIAGHKPAVGNQYIRAVRPQGNLMAQRIIKTVFQVSDACWRGLGKIPKSGLKIRNEFAQFDAEKKFPVNYRVSSIEYRVSKCKCADVLKGLIRPDTCPLFKKTCSPENPYGPCMVSGEGSCNVYYRYK